MRIKKYEASDMKEAIQLIKRDFGPDAIILHSRTVNRGGVFGMFSREMVEVMAGVDINILEPDRSQKPVMPRMVQVQKASSPSHNTTTSPVVDTIYTPRIVSTQEPPSKGPLEIKVQHLSREMEDIRDTLSIIMKKVANSPHPMIAPGLIPYYKLLESIGLGEDLSIRILQEVESNFRGSELENHERILGYIKQKMVTMLGNVHPIDLDMEDSKRIIALVGATGVGKTTTIAKMAANFSLIQKKDVALITIDTFRIAAIEQLKNYANIIGIPLEVVFNMEDFTSALRKFKHKDLILIDTAGRSPKNSEQMLELKKFLKNSYIDTCLVLSVTAKPRDIYKTVSRYNMLGCDKVIFTKLDETDARGAIFDVVVKYGKKLSYFTNGQNVPDDFEVAYPTRVVNLMFNGIQEDEAED